MLSNYVKVALRDIHRNRSTAFINVLGLAVGMCCFLSSFLYIRYELGYDSDFAGADNIYRISIDSTLPNGRQIKLASAAWPVAELLQQEFTEVKNATRLDARKVLLSTDLIAAYQDQFRLVDTNFFSVFEVQWLEGDPATALVTPESVVLTESLAKRYFGVANPLGMRMLMDNEYPLLVTGVIADLPIRSHLTGTAFASTQLLRLIFDDPASYLENWNYSGLHTYFELAPGANIAHVQQGLDAFEARHLKSYAGVTNHMRITSLKDIYRSESDRGALKPHLNMSMLYIVGCVALLILLIACVNFVNLTLARSLTRLREVRVRKSIGSGRGQLVLQFVGEAVLMTALAALLAVLFLELLLPVASQFFQRPLTFNPGDDIGKLALLALVVGVAAGLYPAWHLSSLSPTSATRGVTVTSRRGLGLLKDVLVVFQFTISIILLVATVVVLLQLRYLRAMDTGFLHDGVITLQGSPVEGLGNRLEALKQKLLENPLVVAVTASSHTPFQSSMPTVNARSSEQAETVEMARLYVSHDFFATYGINVLAGRAFSPDFGADMLVLEERLGADTKANVILNAAGAAALGWGAEEAIGMPLEVFIEDSYIYRGTVVGVVADSLLESAYQEIRPAVFLLTPSVVIWSYPTLDHVSVRLSGIESGEALQFIDATWAEVYPDVPLVRGFVTDDLERVYISEKKLGDTLGLFALFAQFIACLGLYSLATFNAQQRIKEIGIRKVIGGSVWQIALLLTTDFSRLVLIANIIAWPVVWVAMQRWLEQFAYRIDLTPLIFIGSGLIALCVAWVTVGSTAAKAAAAKPVLALRYE